MNALVYSTDQGRLCPGCQRPAGDCRCRQANAEANAGGDGIIRIMRQTSGRKGKGVTLVSGLPGTADQLAGLARQLKQHCGCGGAVKNHCIEIQGDKREQVALFLRKLGYTVKLAGG